MWRRLQHILAGLSLIIWLATAVVWVRGKLVDWDGFGVGYRWERGELGEVNSFEKYRVKRAGPRGHVTDELYLASEQGSFGLLVVDQRLAAGDAFFSEERPGWRRLHGIPLDLTPSSTWIGFGSGVEPAYKGWSFGLIFPQWFVLLVATPLPARFLWRHLRRGASARQGCCRSCGYDCRATPERCPECGAAAGS